MYNGIGLTSAKGSGTNGYVQKNMATITQSRLDFQKLNKSFKAGPDIKVKKANVELLLHEQKRKVEIDLIKLEDELTAAGMGEDEIERTITRERGNMLSAVNEGSLRYDSELKKTDTHQLAIDKEKELAVFEKALRIDKGAHVHGAAFDQALQEQLKVERMQARAEQEQKRLVAAEQAEKAQAKAEKLREKAEKAKKKAEAKLAKLKAKQEKRKLKEEEGGDDKKAKKDKGAKKENIEPNEEKKGKKEKKDKAKKEGSDSDSSDSSDSSSSSSSSSDSSGSGDSKKKGDKKLKAKQEPDEEGKAKDKSKKGKAKDEPQEEAKKEGKKREREASPEQPTKENKKRKAASDPYMGAEDSPKKKPSKDAEFTEQERRVNEDLKQLEKELRGTGMKDKEVQQAVKEERKSMMEAIKAGILEYDTKEEAKGRDRHGDDRRKGVKEEPARGDKKKKVSDEPEDGAKKSSRDAPKGDDRNRRDDRREKDEPERGRDTKRRGDRDRSPSSRDNKRRARDDSRRR